AATAGFERDRGHSGHLWRCARVHDRRQGARRVARFHRHRDVHRILRRRPRRVVATRAPQGATETLALRVHVPRDRGPAVGRVRGEPDVLRRETRLDDARHLPLREGVVMRLVVPWGFYGWGNIGDEATLNGFARLMELSTRPSTVWVGSRNPVHTAKVEPAFR